MATWGSNEAERVGLMPSQVVATNQDIPKAGMEGQISVQLHDYHRLGAIDGYFDGVYAIESHVHSASTDQSATGALSRSETG